MSYQEQIKDPRWRSRRRQIIKRDRFRCVDCSAIAKLQVHHICYVDRRAPWDYPDLLLVTLCERCHQRRHVEWDAQIAWDERLILAIKQQANPSYQPTERERILEAMNRIVATLPFPWWGHIRYARTV